MLIADEPTGNLDTKTSREVMELIGRLNRNGMTVIMVTHSTQCAIYPQRILHLSDDKLTKKDHSANVIDVRKVIPRLKTRVV